MGLRLEHEAVRETPIVQHVVGDAYIERLIKRVERHEFVRRPDEHQRHDNH